MPVRIAMLSPAPPQHTGVADYVSDLIPALSRLAELHLFTEVSDVPTSLAEGCQIHPVQDYAALRWRYDMALFQMGNSLYHRQIRDTMLRYPGILVLHDETLHHLISSVTIGEGDFVGYIRELSYEHGLDGTRRARKIRAGAPTPLFTWPLNTRLVELSLGTLVHSRYLRDRLVAAHPLAVVDHVPQPIPLPELPNRSEVRLKLGVPTKAFVIVTCGAITPEKRLDLVAEAFLRLRADNLDIAWLIVGEQIVGRSTWYDQIVAAGEANRVTMTGYLPDLAAFNAAVGAADTCVNLRDPSSGETSASALRALALGLPVVVSDSGWYREVPASAAAFIQHGPTEVDQVERTLRRWYQDRSACVLAGEAGRAYVHGAHAPSAVASAYVAFAERVLSALGHQPL